MNRQKLVVIGLVVMVITQTITLISLISSLQTGQMLAKRQRITEHDLTFVAFQSCAKELNIPVASAPGAEELLNTCVGDKMEDAYNDYRLRHP